MVKLDHAKWKGTVNNMSSPNNKTTELSIRRIPTENNVGVRWLIMHGAGGAQSRRSLGGGQGCTTTPFGGSSPEYLVTVLSTCEHWSIHVLNVLGSVLTSPFFRGLGFDSEWIHCILEVFI